MATKPWAIGLVFLSTFVVSFGQILFKFGSMDFSIGISLLFNYPLILGLVLYGVGAGMLIVALKYGDLSVLYPIYGATYIWVSLLSPHFFNDSMNMLKWIGIAFILLGVASIGRGSRE